MAYRAYRVCKQRYAPLDTQGATLHGGRWHSPGRAVLYAALSFGGALLEILAHAGREQLPGAHHVVTIDIPDDVVVRRIEPGDAPGWNDSDAMVGRALGDAWLANAETVALIVPSAVAAPHDWNVALNPIHPDFKQLVIGKPEPVRWDSRLLPSASIARPMY